MDRNKLGWYMAGACSIAIHAFIILLFVLFGKTPDDPAPQAAPGKAAREKAPDQSPPGAPHESAAPAAPPAPPEPRTRNYTVKPGDNLTRLARNAGTTPAELAKLNGVDEKELAKLKVGQIIKLPAAD